MIRPKSVLSVVLLLCSSAFAARVERIIDTWRPTHYVVNVTLNDQLSEITNASARIDVSIIKPTRTIDFDFGDLTVDSVTLNSTPVLLAHRDGKLSVALPQPVSRGDAL